MPTKTSPKQFLVTTRREMDERGWKEIDILLVTGDAYVDHPSYGTAVIGRVLEDAGYRVGIIAQPDWKTKAAFEVLGRPRLFAGVTAGNVDSMLAHYSAQKVPRKRDDYSPAGKIGLRPDRATIVYSNRLREAFPGVRLVVGGLEASLRRLAHYDYWSESVRRSILLDAKADILVYGMGERPITVIAGRLRDGGVGADLTGIGGTVIARKAAEVPSESVELPSYEEVRDDKEKFNLAFRLAYLESDPLHGKPVIQRYGDRAIVHYPPALPFTSKELDHIYDLPYVRAYPPVYESLGGIPAFETVRTSVTSHRGCAGECSFCGLFFHQGRIVQSRSLESIEREVRALTEEPYFHGTITDIGGPTANLYAATCASWSRDGACRDRHCLMPKRCPNLKLGYVSSIELWDRLSKVPGVKHVFVGSGVRYDLLVGTEAEPYLEALCERHISGRLKVAPEHRAPHVLELMQKPGAAVFEEFERSFAAMNAKLGKEQFLVRYYLSAHPGATIEDAKALAAYLEERHIHPEQIQDYVPLPMTRSAAMYYTGKDPMTGAAVHVPRSPRERRLQRALLQMNDIKNRKFVHYALNVTGRGRRPSRPSDRGKARPSGASS